jgi:uncharacterized Fe-S cluster protein YjdI
MQPHGKKYSAPGIDVFFEPRLCIHAARCVAGLPAVFDPNRRPWIQPANATPDELADVIARCPTGALHFIRTDGGGMEPRPDANVVSVVANGPLYISGEISVETLDGTPVAKDYRLALCRCGASKNKPYCDNSHIAIGFEG